MAATISKIIQALEPSATLAMAAKAREMKTAGKKVYDFSVGEPDFTTPQHICDAAAKAMADGHTHYTASGGIAELRSAVAKAYQQTHGLEYGPQQVVVSNGAKHSLHNAFTCLCDPGDEVIAPRPSYPLFELLAGLEGVRVRQYPLRYAEGWFIDQEALRAEITPRTKAILVVHPNNPTGSFVSAAELDQLTACGLPIISDEVFAGYALAPNPLPTLGENGRVLTFVLDGLSKSAGLPQMKAGWIRVSGPGAAEARHRLELIADTYLSISTPVQWALPELIAAGVQTQIMERIQTNRQLLPSALRIDGGWCAILRMPASRTDEEWAMHLLEQQRVLVQPGYFFDLEGGPYLVVSLLTEPGTFAEGMRRLTV